MLALFSVCMNACACVDTEVKLGLRLFRRINQPENKDKIRIQIKPHA